MDPYRLSVYAHIVFAILLTGLALFWSIMTVALRRYHSPEEAVHLLRIVNASRWPHVAIPYAWRLPLPWVAWAVILVLALTGFASLAYREAPDSIIWWIKMALCASVVVLQAFLTRTPAATPIRLNLIFVVAAIVAAGWSTRPGG